MSAQAASVSNGSDRLRWVLRLVGAQQFPPSSDLSNVRIDY